MATPLRCGPGIVYSLQPSGHAVPVAAIGPVSGPLHRRRSKLAMWPLASTAHSTPSVVTSAPRGLKPESGFFGSFHGTSYISVSFVFGSKRVAVPGKPNTTAHTVPSKGLGLTEYRPWSTRLSLLGSTG